MKNSFLLIFLMGFITVAHANNHEIQRVLETLSTASISEKETMSGLQLEEVKYAKEIYKQISDLSSFSNDHCCKHSYPSDDCYSATGKYCTLLRTSGSCNGLSDDC